MGVLLPAPVSSVNGQTGAVELTLASSFTDVLGVAHGGTGSATQNFVDLSSTQTVGGKKTFTNEIVTVASSSSHAGFNLPSGSPPTSPVAGDVWNDGTYLHFYNGSTNGIMATLASNQTFSGSNTFTGSADFQSSLSSHNFTPDANNTYNLGSSSNYWSNLYATTVNLNSTASLSGETAGALTATGKIVTAASGTGGAGFNLPSGTAPTSPNSGDLYYDGTSLQFHKGSTSVALDHPADWTASDSSLIAWAYDPTGNTASTVALATAGTLYLIKVHVTAPASITNIVMDVNAAGSGLTTDQCFAALYNASTGALVGTTADQSTAWGTTGIKTMALSGGPFSVSAGYYYVAVWFNGTTGPAFSRTQGTSLINVGLAATASRWGTANTGTTTTAPSTLGTIAAASNSYWAALS